MFMRKITYDDIVFYWKYGYTSKHLFGKFYLLRRYSVKYTPFSLWDLVIVEDRK